MVYPNPFKVIWQYYERSGKRTDLNVWKRMMAEIPHVPIGMALMTICIGGSYGYLQYFYKRGLGYQTHYTVLRPDDPKIPLYRDEILNAEKYLK